MKKNIGITKSLCCTVKHCKSILIQFLFKRRLLTETQTKNLLLQEGFIMDFMKYLQDPNLLHEGTEENRAYYIPYFAAKPASVFSSAETPSARVHVSV